MEGFMKKKPAHEQNKKCPCQRDCGAKVKTKKKIK
jgi:hypothetical protein